MATLQSHNRRTLANLQWHYGAGESDDGNLAVVEQLGNAIEAGERLEVIQVVANWPQRELLELLTQLPLQLAQTLHQWLPAGPALKVLVELDPEINALLAQESTITRLADIVRNLDDHRAVRMLRRIPRPERQMVLELVDPEGTLAGKLLTDRDQLAPLIQDRLVAVPETWRVGDVTTEIRAAAKEIEKIHEVFLIDDSGRFTGQLKLRDLLLNPKDTVLREIARQGLCVTPDDDIRDVLQDAVHSDLDTMAVVDASHHIIGRVTVQELQNLITQDLEEDMKTMSGLPRDARPFEDLHDLIRGRLPWLVLGLMGASIAAVVVGLFEDQLARATILASFIPVIMATAGNVGIQTSTLTVQGLNSGEIRQGGFVLRTLRELAGAIINGALLALLMLSVVYAVAVTVNIEDGFYLALSGSLALLAVVLIAAMIGSVVPVLLERMGIDPALATGVFITTLNDVLGVIAFFLIAEQVYLGV